MNLYTKFTIAAVMTSTAAISLLNPSAMAFTIIPNNDPDVLRNALLGTTTGLTLTGLDVIGHPEAVGLFSNDPFGLNSGIVLSTGKVIDIPGKNTEDGGITANLLKVSNDLSTAFIAPDTPDKISLNISFDTDHTVSKLFFQYVFGSEEFVEFGGSKYNDSFSLLLNGTNLAKLSDGQTVTINNLVPDPHGPFHADYINNPAGPETRTRLDGYTQILTFEGLLRPNTTNILTINIEDVGDGLLDSAVFLKGGSLGTSLPPEPEKVPELRKVSEPEKVPEPGLAIASFVVGGLLLRKSRKPSSRSRD